MTISPVHKRIQDSPVDIKILLYVVKGRHSFRNFDLHTKYVRYLLYETNDIEFTILSAIAQAKVHLAGEFIGRIV